MASPLTNDSQRWVAWFILGTYVVWGIVDIALLLSGPANDTISRVHLLLGWQNAFFMPFLMGVLTAHYWWNGEDLLPEWSPALLIPISLGGAAWTHNVFPELHPMVGVFLGMFCGRVFWPLQRR
jgi:hypothetical protein